MKPQPGVLFICVITFLLGNMISAQLPGNPQSWNLADTTDPEYPLPEHHQALLFGIPDTVCVNQWVNIIPGSISGSNFQWTFCSADAGEPPVASSLGNPSGLIDNPGYITLVRDGTDCFSFMTNLADSSIIRTFYGNSFNNSPVSSFNLGSINILSSKLRGLQIHYDNDTWLGYIVDGSTLYRFTFSGNTLFGQPQIIHDIPFPNVGASSGLIIRREGVGWVGFATDNQNNNLVRLYFPSQLTVPQVENLGDIGDLNGPTGLSMIRWNGQCFLFIANEGNSTLTRVEFGASFMGTPNGTNLGNIGGVMDHNAGIEVVGDCETVNGYVTNLSQGSNGLIHLQFPLGPAGMPVANSLGNPGGLYKPFALSELVRTGDSIFGLIPNTGDNTLTRMIFPSCSAASRPGDQKLVPDPFYYLEPGTWNIHLSYLDAGSLPQEECKPIVVIPELQVSLGPDRTICEGTLAILDAGQGYAGYTWSTGENSQTVNTDTSGTYWVKVINSWGCEAADTVSVAVMNTIEVNVDTTLCSGEQYWAEGAWQTAPGTYRDSTFTTAGCDSITITELAFKAQIQVNLGQDTLICPDEQILLNATHPGATYLWQDGSTDSIFQVTEPGIYYVVVTYDDCSGSDSLTVNDCPSKLWFPNAFTPNKDGLNDIFRPVGISIYAFRMVIFDRWGQQLFETYSIEEGWDGTRNGQDALAGTYSFIVYYSSTETDGQTVKTSGTFTLVR